MHCVQEQFTFIHDAILESVTCGDTQISATNLRMNIAKMIVTINPMDSSINLRYIMDTETVWYGVVILICPPYRYFGETAVTDTFGKFA